MLNRRKGIIVSIVLSVILTSMTSCGISSEKCSMDGCKNDVYKEGVCPDHYVEKQSTQNKVTDSSGAEQKESTIPEETLTPSATPEVTVEPEPTAEPEPTVEPIPTIKIGQTIKTKKYKFTLNKVELAKVVEPDNPPDYYSYYSAKAGKIYVHVDLDVMNKQKQSIDSDDVCSLEVDYNDGYKYNAFSVIEDHEGDFTYSEYIDPLEKAGLHLLAECPKRVEKSKDKSLFLTITFFDGKEYKYTIRK